MHLAHDQMEEGDQQERQKERGALGDPARRPPFEEQRPESVVDCRLGDRAKDKGGDRDAKLSARQHQGQIIHAA